MARNLIEGIVIVPSGGRSVQKLDLPTVPGVDVAALEAQKLEADIAVTTKPVLFSPVQAESTATLAGDFDGEISQDDAPTGFVNVGFPLIEFDLSQYIRIENAKPPYSIVLLGAEEESDSIQSEPWSADENPFIAMDETGRVRYTPKGIFFHNVIRIEYEIFDAEAPETEEVEEAIDMYRQREPEEQDPGDVVTTPEERAAQEAAQRELPKRRGTGQRQKDSATVVLTGNIVGEGRGASREFFDHQGTDPTCLVAATAGVLASLGITDANGDPLSYDDVLEIIALKVDANGNPIDPSQTVIQKESPAHGQQHIYQQTIDADGNRNVERNPLQAGVLTDVGLIAEHYGATVEFGYAYDPAVLFSVLDQGNSLILHVDSRELYDDPLVAELLSDGSGKPINGIDGTELDWGANHVITLNGLQQDADGNWYSVINDTAHPDGAGTLIPLSNLLGSLEDSEGAYAVVTLPDTPETPGAPTSADVQTKEQLRSDIEGIINDWDFNENDAQIRIGGGGDLTRAFLTTLIEDPDLLDVVEASHPGFKEKVAELKELTEAERSYLEGKYGIEFDDIDDLWRLVNVE